jgi:copper chaperone CopZ
MKKLFVLAIFIFSAQSSFAVTTIKAEVNGMVCAFCAKGIEKKLNALPEGHGSFVDLKSRIVLLELKEQQNVSIEKFKKIIEDAGYSVNKVEKVELPISEIKTSNNAKEVQ